MSYFAKPNFIIYDEWFDEDIEKNKLDIKNKKIETISKIHQFYYEQSNYKVGGSENNLQLDSKFNKKELITNKFLKKTFQKNSSISNKKYRFFPTFIKNNLKFIIKKKLIYSLSILSFLFIFGLLLFFIPQNKKNESKITNKSFILEKKF